MFNPSVTDLLNDSAFVADARKGMSIPDLQALYAPLQTERRLQEAAKLAREVSAFASGGRFGRSEPVEPISVETPVEHHAINAYSPLTTEQKDTWTQQFTLYADGAKAHSVPDVEPDAVLAAAVDKVYGKNVPTGTVATPDFTTTNSPVCTVFLPDIHIPFEDKAALNAALALVAHLKPSTLYLLGDVHDNPQMSSYARDLETDSQLQSDLDKIDAFLTRLRSIVGTACKVYWIEGNHEERTARWMLTNGRHLSSLRCMKPQEYYKLDKHNVEWIPANQTHIHNGIVVTHGTVVRSGSGASGKGELGKYGVSGISGHVHRLGMYRTHDLRGDHCWFETGCLCQLTPEYMQGVPNWHQGLAIGHFLPSEKRFQVDLVPIFDGKLLYGGQVFGA